MLAKGSENRSRVTAIFGSRFKQLNDFTHGRAKIPLAPSGKSVASVCASCSTRGAYRDRHGRWRQDAMDVLACSDEARECGRQRRVVLISRRWDQVLQAMICEATVATKPGSPGRARDKP